MKNCFLQLHLQLGFLDIFYRRINELFLFRLKLKVPDALFGINVQLTENLQKTYQDKMGDA